MDKRSPKGYSPRGHKVGYDLSTKEQHCINSTGHQVQEKEDEGGNLYLLCNNEKWLWQSDFEKLATIIYRVITHGLFKMNKEDRNSLFKR